MHRVRMSLPYFYQNGWEVEIVTVDEKYSDMNKDELLLVNIPTNIKVHRVKALSKNWTSKFGLGSLALRSIYYFKLYVDQLLKSEHFDLIYFSTTQFPILILGAFWRKKFNIPYVIDIQDPWYTTYYDDKPKLEKPPKHWFSNRLNKYLEPIAMKRVNGLISVSEAYLHTLQKRYPRLKRIPQKVITFGAFKTDFDLVNANNHLFPNQYLEEKDCLNFVYVGRGGHDMKLALNLLFTAFKKGITENFQLFKKIRFHFIGTSYASNGEGKPTIKPIANEMNIGDYVFEQTDRISFFASIHRLIKADALLIIGSDDAQYTASKIYPYILAERPLLAILHPESSAAKIIKNCNSGLLISLKGDREKTISTICQALADLANKQQITETDWHAFEPYSALNMTINQVALFNKVIAK